jgi:hypothetical protein
MTRPDDKIRSFPDASPAESVRVYEAYHGLLLEMLTRSFGVPAEHAEVLVYETIMAFQMAEHAPDPECFLIAGAREKGMRYQQAQGVTAGADADAALVRGALHLLAGQAREAVRLRFEERMAYRDIAMALGITVFAAEQLVVKTVAKIRRLQKG